LWNEFRKLVDISSSENGLPRAKTIIRPVRTGESRSSRTALPAIENGVLYRSVKGG
jgi:hypothetical protein